MVFWAPVAAAGISAAASIGGGLLSRPDQSERDLMWEAQKIKEYGLEHDPSTTMRGLRNAGVNPMLPFSKGPPSSAPVPSVPNRMYDPVGEGVGKAGASAVQAYRVANEIERMQAETKNIKETNRQIRATTENIAANTVLTTAKAQTESLQPSVIQIQNELSTAKTETERQNLQKRIIETAIAKQDLSVAEKDAVIASIDIDMYESSVGEVSRWLTNLGIKPQAAVGLAHMLWSYARSLKRR